MKEPNKILESTSDCEVKKILTDFNGSKLTSVADNELDECNKTINQTKLVDEPSSFLLNNLIHINPQFIFGLITIDFKYQNNKTDHSYKENQLFGMVNLTECNAGSRQFIADRVQLCLRQSGKEFYLKPVDNNLIFKISEKATYQDMIALREGVKNALSQEL